MRPAPRRAHLVLLLALIGTAVAACGTGQSPGSATPAGSAPASASATPGASAAPGASLPPSPVDGVVVHVESTGLTDVRGFDLRLVDGTVLTFTIGRLDNPTQFPAGHLAEHLATASPVRVWFRVVGGAPVAFRLEDAAP